ncbi:helix-turn-helix domain-containing protein [Terribacillus sp. 179-K 1B1 HS]|uniref:AraC family transcriptional regulator n=1 Tax=Terribacillus sp. 179-K 1B1 HS TaxID=3142388 RepID=UPI0039A0E649
MNHKELDYKLRKWNSIEKKQYKTGENINDIELVINHSEAIPRMKEKYFFDQGPIFISKHHRFADMPIHTHDFIEINYMYAGTCRQFINGQEVRLEQGQLCILDKDVPHGIATLQEEDILINILMKKETFSSSFFDRLSRKGILSTFLMRAVEEDHDHNRYIVFHSQDNENLQYIIKNMICEFMDPMEYSTEIISHYALVLFTELKRVYKHSKNFQDLDLENKTNIIDLLSYIESNYMDISLNDLSLRFNFNPNYLGNMLKEKTGKTFTELLQAQRMTQATHLLENTQKTITEIARQVGYENHSFFYRKFKAHFECTPTAYRKEKQIR